MKTNSRTIPILDCLTISVTMSGVRLQRHPTPCYYVAYRLLLLNSSEKSVRLEGRKWILRDRQGNTRIIEAANVFNQQPVLTPGAVYCFSGEQRFTLPPQHMEISLFGTDARNNPFITPPFIFPKHCFNLPW